MWKSSNREKNLRRESSVDEFIRRAELSREKYGSGREVSRFTGHPRRTWKEMVVLELWKSAECGNNRESVEEERHILVI